MKIKYYCIMILFLICKNAYAHSDVRLYTLDCGAADFKDLQLISDTGEYDHRSGHLANACFLIKHKKEWLLWDTGISDSYVKRPINNNGTYIYKKKSLVSQLTMLGLSPKDISYIAVSHLHFDHAGNLGKFGSVTWILQKKELEHALKKPTPFSIDQNNIALQKKVKKIMIDGDYDVSGDQSVRLIFTPGHTPGHEVLLLNLKNSGSVILSGDLYILRNNLDNNLVPVINSSRSDTLASMNRIDGIIKNNHAKLIVQHDENDLSMLPKLPGYLD